MEQPPGDDDDMFGEAMAAWEVLSRSRAVRRWRGWTRQTLLRKTVVPLTSNLHLRLTRTAFTGMLNHYRTTLTQCSEFNRRWSLRRGLHTLRVKTSAKSLQRTNLWLAKGTYRYNTLKRAFLALTVAAEEGSTYRSELKSYAPRAVQIWRKWREARVTARLALVLASTAVSQVKARQALAMWRERVKISKDWVCHTLQSQQAMGHLLLSRALRVWRRGHRLQRFIATTTSTFAQGTKQWALGAWREARRHIVLNRLARGHWKEQVQRRVLQTLEANREGRTREGAKVGACKVLLERRRVFKALQCWRVWTIEERANERAAEHLRLTFLNKAMGRWVEAAKLKREEDALDHIASSHCRHHTLLWVFSHWVARTQSRTRVHTTTQALSLSLTTSAAKRALMRWRAWAPTSRTLSLSTTTTLYRAQKAIKVAAMRAWRTALNRTRKQRQGVSVLTSLARKHRLSRAWVSLQAHTQLRAVHARDGLLAARFHRALVLWRALKGLQRVAAHRARAVEVCRERRRVRVGKAVIKAWGGVAVRERLAGLKLLGRLSFQLPPLLSNFPAVVGGRGGGSDASLTDSSSSVSFATATGMGVAGDGLRAVAALALQAQTEELGRNGRGEDPFAKVAAMVGGMLRKAGPPPGGEPPHLQNK